MTIAQQAGLPDDYDRWKTASPDDEDEEHDPDDRFDENAADEWRWDE